MPETGKDRSSRIEMDYYRQRDGLSQWKIGMAVTGLIAGCLALVYALIDSSAASPGLLAEGHAAFESNCSKCHEPLTPIGTDAIREMSLLGISESASIEHTFNACTACHNGVGHPIGNHHRGKMTGAGQLADKNCASCHADHRGRLNDLTLVGNQNCTVCHADLSDVCPSGQIVKDLRIESFVDQHGDFASLKQGDPGTVTFDHAQHMLPGQPSKGRDVVRLRDLEPNQRGRYRSKMLQLKAMDPQFADLDVSDDALVQLDCSSCHELAGSVGNRSSVSQVADIEVGRHIAPISYDSHCSACHSINVPGRDERTLALPHAAPWAEIDQWLRAKLPQSNSSASSLPGPSANPTGIGVVRSVEPLDAQARLREDEAMIAVLREMVRQQCLKCHEENLVKDDEAIMAARDVQASTLIPSRWLAKGIYDHGAHAKINCRFCHAEAYAEGNPSQPGQDQDKVMISGIESCRGCHRPEDEPTPMSLLVDSKPHADLGGQPLWASDRCVTCHRYHGLSRVKVQASMGDRSSTSRSGSSADASGEASRDPDSEPGEAE